MRNTQFSYLFFLFLIIKLNSAFAHNFLSLRFINLMGNNPGLAFDMFCFSQLTCPVGVGWSLCLSWLADVAGSERPVGWLVAD